MRICGWAIDGFGLFAGSTSGELPGGLCVFHGANEAGKSTLLGFVRTILFGFPRANAARELHFPPQSGGRHGGRLLLCLDNGDGYTVERYQDRGGSPAVSGPGGQRGGEELLQSLLRGVSAEVYRSIFAFSLAELQDFASVREAGVQGALYGAGPNAASRSLPEARRRLRGRLEELFKRGGSNPRINQLLSALEQVQTQLREASGEADAYAAAVAARSEVAALLSARDGELSRLAPQRSRVEAHIKLWPDWIELQECERRLEQQGEVGPFPAGGAEQLQRLLDALAQDRRRLEGQQRLAVQARADLEGLVVDGAVLANGQAIELLERGRERYVEDAEALLRVGEELVGAEERVQRLLDQLGPGWDAQRLARMDRSLFTREAIRDSQSRLAAAGEQAAAAQSALAVREQTRDQARAEWAAADERLRALPAADAAVDASTVQALERGRDQIAAVARDLPVVEARRRQAREQLERAVRDIGPDWNLDRLGSFDSSVAAQERLQASEQRLTAALQHLASCQAEVSRLEGEQLRLAERLEAARQDLEQSRPAGPADSSQVEQRRARLRELRGCLQLRERVERDAESLQERLTDRQAERQRLGRLSPSLGASLAPGWLVAGGAVLVWLLWLSHSAMGLRLAVAWGVAVAGAGVWLWLQRRRRRAEAAARHAEELFQVHAAIEELRDRQLALNEQRAGLEQDLAGHADALGFPQPVGLHAVEEEELRLTQEHDRLVAWERRAEQLRELEQQLGELGTAVVAGGERAVAAQGQLETARGEWSKHLAAGGLPGDMSPRTAAVVFTKVDALRGQARALHDLDERVAQMRQSAAQYAAAAAAVPSLAAAAQTEDPAALLAAVDEFAAQWRQQEAVRLQRDSAAASCAELRRLLEQAEAEVEQAQKRRDSLRAEQEAVRRTWQEWLAKVGFSGELTPATAMDALDIVEQGLVAVARRESLAGQRDTLAARVRAFEEGVVKMLVPLGRSRPARDQLPAAIHAVYVEYQTARDHAARAAEIRRSLTQMDSEIDDLQLSCQKRQAELERLYAAADVADEGAFRARAEAVALRQQLGRQAEASASTLAKIAGTEDLPGLRQALSATSLEALVGQQQGYRLAAEELARERDQLLQKSAELQHQIDGLRTSDKVARLRAEEERLRAQIAAAAREWTRYALAQALLVAAQDKYEREQQPQVIREASTFLERITAGQYQRIVAPVGEDRIEAVAADGSRRQPQELSRGTAEQLYLAIRFGYIRHRAAYGEPLPVVMDDILVNFDPGRARRAATAICELAGDHQVLFFTCHPETVELFRQAQGTVPVYQLADGRLEPA